MSLCQPLKLNLLGCFTSHLLPSLQSLLATCFLCFFSKLFDSPLQPQLYQPTCPQQMYLQLLDKAPASHLNDIVATQSAVLLSSASSQYLICLTSLLAGIRSSQWTLTLILIDQSDIDLLCRCGPQALRVVSMERPAASQLSLGIETVMFFLHQFSVGLAAFEKCISL